MSVAVLSSTLTAKIGTVSASHPFRVRVTLHQIVDAERAQPRVDHVESIYNAVMREYPIVLEKRVGVAHFQGRTGRVAHVGDERRTGQLVRFGRKLAVLPCGHRLLVDHRLTVGLEHPEPGAVGIAFALVDEIVGCLEQPEGRSHHPPVGVQTKQTAHAPMVALPRRERNG
jgi:hypothetical protein